jgi:hypothetical protein
MATKENTSINPKAGFIRISNDRFDYINERLEQIAAQIQSFAIVLTDNDDGAKPSDQLIGVSLFGIGNSVEEIREKLLDETLKGGAA